MLRSLFIFTLLASPLVLCSCGDRSGKSPSATAAATEPEGFHNIADVPKGVRDEYEAFGRAFEADLRAGNLEKLKSYFDTAGATDRICNGLEGDPAVLVNFKRGLTKGVESTLSGQGKDWAESHPKFKGVVIYQNQPAARFRFTKEGIAVIDLVLSKGPGGGMRVTDFYNHAVGGSMSEMARQAAAPMLGSLDRRFFSRLLNGAALSHAELSKVIAFYEKVGKRDSAGALAEYPGLPASIREGHMVTTAYLALLQQGPDEKAYQKALKEAATRFKSANFQFMLVDLYFFEKNFVQAIACVDTILEAVGVDAALLTLKATLQKENGDLPTALATLREAMADEPDCEYAHISGLPIFLDAKDYKGVRDSLLALEKTGKYDFKKVMGDPQWADFKKSPESAAWR